MNSKIYIGEVTHARLAPVKHSFCYPVYFYAFDLEELSELARQTLLPRFNSVYPLNLLLFGIASVGCYLAARQVPFNAGEILWEWRQSLYLLTLYLLHAVPFFFAANGIALALSRYREAVSLTYAADLLGAGIGALAVIALLFLMLPHSALKVIAMLGLLAALVAAHELPGSRRRTRQLAATGTLALQGTQPDTAHHRNRGCGDALQSAGPDQRRDQ